MHPRRCVPLLVLLGAIGASGCRSREAEIRDDLTRLAADGITAVGADLRLAICGWTPARTETLKVRGLTVALKGGDAAKGNGEIDASFETASGHLCTGKATFSFEHRTSANRPSYVMTQDIRRIGGSPIFAELEGHAVPLALDAPVDVRFDAWKLPDGVGAQVLRVELPAAGRRCVRVRGDATFTVYQSGEPVIDPGGALSNVDLGAGPAWILLTSNKAAPVTLTVDAKGC